MAIAQSVKRIGTLAVEILHSRIRLAALEMEEESLRIVAYLALALLALLCFSIAIVLLAFLVIVLFWDEYRIGAIVCTMAVFAAAGCALLLGVRSSFRRKPKLLSFTIAELGKDLDSMRNFKEAN